MLKEVETPTRRRRRRRRMMKESNCLESRGGKKYFHVESEYKVFYLYYDGWLSCTHTHTHTQKYGK